MESAGDIKLKKQVEMVFMANRWGNNGNSDRLNLGVGAPKPLQMVTAAMKLKDACSLEGKL